MAEATPSCRRSALRLLRAAVSVFALFAWLVAAHARGAPVIESTREGDAVLIRASAELGADHPTAWRVLTDYERYAEFIPGLVASRILARSGPLVVVEQRGRALLGPLRLPIEITFEILERPPDALESRAVAGSLRSLESRYALLATERGSRLIDTGRIEPGFPLFDTIEQAIVEANVARQFRALVEEIERRAAIEAAPASSSSK